MKYLSLFLCLRYLLKKKLILLSVISVAISCSLLIVVSSLFNGFIEKLQNGAKDYLGDVIITAPIGQKIPDSDKLIKYIETNPALESATAVINSQGLLLLGKGDVRAVSIWGIELDKRKKFADFQDTLLAQAGKENANFSYPQKPDQNGGFVSIGLVSDLDYKTDNYDLDQAQAALGKKVMITTGKAERGQNVQAKSLKFIISDVVYSGLYEFDSTFVYLPIDRLGQLLYPDIKNPADTIQIRTAPGLDTDTAAAIVRGLWQEFCEKENILWARHADITTAVRKQAQIIAEYEKQMGMLLLIFGVICFGVVFLISCIFYMIVMTKRKDIGIIKSCGLGWLSTMWLFIAFGLAIGIVGALAGTAIGYAVVKNINVIEPFASSVIGVKLWKSSTYMFSDIPDTMDWKMAAWISLFSVLAAGLGAMVPAFAAARLKPVKILRYE